MINFENIDYLQTGNKRQREAYQTLTRHTLLERLVEFDPLLAGTVPIGIDLPSSDLDIVCSFQSPDYFEKFILSRFQKEDQFRIRSIEHPAGKAIVANFFLDTFEIELFGQAVPSKQQYAFRHLLVEHQLLVQFGEELRQKVIHLKEQGYKTEPAFAEALGIQGNSYIELLHLPADLSVLSIKK